MYFCYIHYILVVLLELDSHTEILVTEFTVLIPAPFLEVTFLLCMLLPVMSISSLLHTNTFMIEMTCARGKELALLASRTLWSSLYVVLMLLLFVGEPALLPIASTLYIEFAQCC